MNDTNEKQPDPASEVLEAALEKAGEQMAAGIEGLTDSITKVQEYYVAKLETLRADNARLQAIVDKLPKTADGVPVVDGMAIYPLHPIAEHATDTGIVKMLIRDSFGLHDAPFDKNYSTEAAAREALSPAQKGGD